MTLQQQAVRGRLGKELSVAVAAGCEAGAITLKYFGTDRVETRTKGDRDVVTRADVESERLILESIRQHFPDDGVVAEEGSSVPSRSGRSWYVDPLDGTLNYSRRLPIWCVSIALYDGDVPLVAVIHDPVAREMFTAVQGEGAYCNGRAMRGSERMELHEAVVHLTVDTKEGGRSEALDDLEELVPRVMRTRNIGSAALALAYVADGRLDAMLHRFANSWDYAAGVLLIREAGGMVTDMAGGHFTPRTAAICAAGTDPLHRDLLPLLG